jgi:hypothetical protein
LVEMHVLEDTNYAICSSEDFWISHSLRTGHNLASASARQSRL